MHRRQAVQLHRQRSHPAFWRRSHWHSMDETCRALSNSSGSPHGAYVAASGVLPPYGLNWGRKGDAAAVAHNDKSCILWVLGTFWVFDLRMSFSSKAGGQLLDVWRGLRANRGSASALTETELPWSASWFESTLWRCSLDGGLSSCSTWLLGGWTSPGF